MRNAFFRAALTFAVAVFIVLTAGEFTPLPDVDASAWSAEFADGWNSQ